MLVDTANELDQIVGAIAPRLDQINDADASIASAPGKWSKKELLGHLIDSAANNHQKFVRCMLSTEQIDFPGYEQDAWVAVQSYQTISWTTLIALWSSYNRYMAELMRRTPETSLQKRITISGKGPYSLEFLMTDYVEHLKHHLIQMIPDSGLLSHFSMNPYV